MSESKSATPAGVTAPEQQEVKRLIANAWRDGNIFGPFECGLKRGLEAERYAGIVFPTAPASEPVTAKCWKCGMDRTWAACPAMDRSTCGMLANAHITALCDAARKEGYDAAMRERDGDMTVAYMAGKSKAPQAGSELAGLTDEQRTAVGDAIAETLGDAYDCIRVWSAWSYGTMGPDDFLPVAESDERLGELVDAVAAALAKNGGAA